MYTTYLNVSRDSTRRVDSRFISSLENGLQLQGSYSFRQVQEFALNPYIFPSYLRRPPSVVSVSQMFGCLFPCIFLYPKLWIIPFLVLRSFALKLYLFHLSRRPFCQIAVPTTWVAWLSTFEVNSVTRKSRMTWIVIIIWGYENYILSRNNVIYEMS